MKWQVFNALIDMIICREVSCTVKNVSNAVFFQFVVVLGYIITAEVNELLDDFRANMVKKHILILLSRGAFVVEFLIKFSLLLSIVVRWDGNISSDSHLGILEVLSSLDSWWLLFRHPDGLVHTTKRQSKSCRFLARVGRFLIDIFDD